MSSLDLWNIFVSMGCGAVVTYLLMNMTLNVNVRLNVPNITYINHDDSCTCDEEDVESTEADEEECNDDDDNDDDNDNSGNEEHNNKEESEEENYDADNEETVDLSGSELNHGIPMD